MFLIKCRRTVMIPKKKWIQRLLSEGEVVSLKVV